MALGISESIALTGPGLCFKCRDKEALEMLLEQHGMNTEKFSGFEGAFRIIAAPEGTKIYLFDEDFLGESYVVDESDDPPD